MIDAIFHAQMFATFHHVTKKGQLYGPLPYTHHLQDVEKVLAEFGETRTEMRVASWGHDLIEDTDVKARDIEEAFGEEVARLVSAVTSEPGINRKTRNALTYPKIREAGPDAIRLKLADRIANVRFGLNTGKGAKMYAKEHEDFRRALFVEHDGNAVMWDVLDGLIVRAREK